MEIIEINPNEAARFIGQHISAMEYFVVPDAWPIVDRDTLLITAISNDDSGENYVMADLVDGKILEHDRACQFLVEPEVPPMVKIVINKSDNMFLLSDKGLRRYAELKGIKLWVEDDGLTGWRYWTVPPEERTGALYNIYEWNQATWEARKLSAELYNNYILCSEKIYRADPALVQVVEELGEEANGRRSELGIVEIARGTKYRISSPYAEEFVETYDETDWLVA